MDSMIFGRYIPGDSIVHRLDPRSKLLAMMLLILIVFWANNPLTNLILFIATGIFIALSGVSLSFFIQGLKSMFFLIAFTTIFQLFFISNGNVLFEFSFVRITDYALSLCIDYFLFNFVNLNNHAFKFGISCRSFISTFKACESSSS